MMENGTSRTGHSKFQKAQINYMNIWYQFLDKYWANASVTIHTYDHAENAYENLVRRKISNVVHTRDSTIC